LTGKHSRYSVKVLYIEIQQPFLYKHEILLNTCLFQANVPIYALRMVWED